MPTMSFCCFCFFFWRRSRGQTAPVKLDSETGVLQLKEEQGSRKEHRSALMSWNEIHNEQNFPTEGNWQGDFFFFFNKRSKWIAATFKATLPNSRLKPPNYTGIMWAGPCLCSRSPVLLDNSSSECAAEWVAATPCSTEQAFTLRWLLWSCNIVNLAGSLQSLALPWVWVTVCWARTTSPPRLFGCQLSHSCTNDRACTPSSNLITDWSVQALVLDGSTFRSVLHFIKPLRGGRWVCNVLWYQEKYSPQIDRKPKIRDASIPLFLHSEYKASTCVLVLTDNKYLLIIWHKMTPRMSRYLNNQHVFLEQVEYSTPVSVPILDTGIVSIHPWWKCYNNLNPSWQKKIKCMMFTWSELKLCWPLGTWWAAAAVHMKPDKSIILITQWFRSSRSTWGSARSPPCCSLRTGQVSKYMIVFISQGRAVLFSLFLLLNSIRALIWLHSEQQP